MYQNMQEILSDVAAGKLTPDEAEALIAQMEQAQSACEPEWEVVDDASGANDDAHGNADEQYDSIEDRAKRIEHMALNLAENILRKVEKTMESASRDFEERR